MGTVTTLPRGRPLTAADLESMPDDGHRYELVDGTLVVTPAPSTRHQLVSSNLHVLLAGSCPPHLRVLAAPTDVRLADDTVLQPDLLVVPREALDRETRSLSGVLLAVEILSPSTRHVERGGGGVRLVAGDVGRLDVRLVAQLPRRELELVGIDDPVRRAAGRLVARPLEGKVDVPGAGGEDLDCEQDS